MNTALVACMGGWCRRRAACLHYLPGSTAEPVERLCAPGQDRPFHATYRIEARGGNERTTDDHHHHPGR